MNFLIGEIKLNMPVDAPLDEVAWDATKNIKKNNRTIA